MNLLDPGPSGLNQHPGGLSRFPFRAAAIAAALALLPTACSAASPAGSSRQAGAAASPAPGKPDASLPTGAELKARLAPASWFPPGFTIDPHGSADTGRYYQPPSPSAGRVHCTRLDKTSWIGLAGVSAVSFAQNAYINQSSSGEYAQEIDAYRGTGAPDVIAGLRKLARRCPSFRDRQTSSTVTVRLKKGPQLGDDALAFTLTSPRWLGDTTLEAIRAGTAVITVLYSAPSGTGKAQATKLAAAITANLRKGR